MSMKIKEIAGLIDWKTKVVIRGVTADYCYGSTITGEEELVPAKYVGDLPGCEEIPQIALHEHLVWTGTASEIPLWTADYIIDRIALEVRNKTVLTGSGRSRKTEEQIETVLLKIIVHEKE
jgi:hypothetical protein